MIELNRRSSEVIHREISFATKKEMLTVVGKLIVVLDRLFCSIKLVTEGRPIAKYLIILLQKLLKMKVTHHCD